GGHSCLPLGVCRAGARVIVPAGAAGGKRNPRSIGVAPTRPVELYSPAKPHHPCPTEGRSPMSSAPVPRPVRAPTTSSAPQARPTGPGLRVPYLPVVIVNYRQWQDTFALVRQLRQSPALREGIAEVVVVDNHSPADPAVSRLRRCPGVSLWRSRR